MKKIFRPLLTLFFFWTIIGLTVGQPVLAYDYETLNASIMRPDEMTLADWLQKSREAPKTVIDENILQKVMQSMSEGIGASNSLLPRINYVPVERQQGNCGNCWNWAGTGVMEVALNVQRGIWTAFPHSIWIPAKPTVSPAAGAGCPTLPTGTPSRHKKRRFPGPMPTLPMPMAVPTADIPRVPVPAEA